MPKDLHWNCTRAEQKLHRTFWQYARAMALAGQGKLNEAAAEQKQFESLRQAIPAASQFLINNKSSDILAFAAATLDAQLAWARGEQAKSIHAWRRAVEIEPDPDDRLRLGFEAACDLARAGRAPALR